MCQGSATPGFWWRGQDSNLRCSPRGYDVYSVALSPLSDPSVLVRAGGFEPPDTSFSSWRICQGSPTRAFAGRATSALASACRMLEEGAGFEPAPEDRSGDCFQDSCDARIPLSPPRSRRSIAQARRLRRAKEHVRRRPTVHHESQSSTTKLVLFTGPSIAPVVSRLHV